MHHSQTGTRATQLACTRWELHPSQLITPGDISIRHSSNVRTNKQRKQRRQPGLRLVSRPWAPWKFSLSSVERPVLTPLFYSHSRMSVSFREIRLHKYIRNPSVYTSGILNWILRGRNTKCLLPPPSTLLWMLPAIQPSTLVWCYSTEGLLAYKAKELSRTTFIYIIPSKKITSTRLFSTSPSLSKVFSIEFLCKRVCVHGVE